VTDLDESAADEVARQLPGQGHRAVVLDVTQPRSVDDGLAHRVAPARPDLVGRAGPGPSWCHYQAGPWPVPEGLENRSSAHDYGWVVLGERFATHYYRGDREPFQNLSEVEDGDVDAVLATLAGGSRRHFGPRYIALRRATEARARDLFIEAGGHPIRSHPHYMCSIRVPGSLAYMTTPKRYGSS
jgi:hypothetical protein